MMRKLTLILILFFQIFSAIGQEKEEFSILKNSKNWKREIIKFPIEWAPDLKVSGFEELLFSPNWSDKKSDDFWSLVIAWSLEATSSFSQKELEHNFKSYFDGLMKPNHWSTNFPEPKVHFIKNSDKNLNANYVGEMTFFDGLHTGEVITVHIKIAQTFCEKQQKAIVIFLLSPKDFQHKNWKNFNEIKLN